MNIINAYDFCQNIGTDYTAADDIPIRNNLIDVTTTMHMKKLSTSWNFESQSAHCTTKSSFILSAP